MSLKRLVSKENEMRKEKKKLTYGPRDNVDVISWALLFCFPRRCPPVLLPLSITVGGGSSSPSPLLSSPLALTLSLLSLVLPVFPRCCSRPPHCPGGRQPRCQLLAPTVHPASSCSQAWGRVLGCSTWLGLFLAFWGSWCW